MKQDAAPHAVVVGSGFGGLAAAVRLGARGYRVTVLERLDQPGGRAYVFRQDGFTFDAGPTIITAPYLFEELWALCGRNLADDVDLRAMDPFYCIRFADGTTFEYSGDSARMREQVRTFCPADVDGYDRFMTASEETLRIGFEKLGDEPFLSISDMIRVVPDLLRLGGFRTVYAQVSRFFSDPRLRTVFSFHPLLIGGSPFRTTAVYSLIAALERRWGVHFAMGGTGRLVEGLCKLIASQGGTVRCNAEVEEILTQGRRVSGVRLKGGETIDAGIVVSNADTASTYRSLLDRSDRRRWSNRRINRKKYSMSLFVWYFGTSRRFHDVGHHTILLGERYRELLDDIFEHKKLAPDFSLYLHRPTATDPSLAPDGCDTFYVLSPVPHLDGDVDWRTAGEPYRRSIAQYLSETMMPGFEESVVTSRTLTPLDFQDRLLSYKGAAFGMEPLFTQSAWFRPHNRSEDIEGLYLVGAGTHPGAGLPGVLSSAKILDKLIPEGAAVV